MLDIVIIGAGGFGRELYGMLWDCFPRDEYRFKGFLAKDAGELAGHQADAPILCDPEDYQPRPTDRFLLAIGDMDVRCRTVQALAGKDAVFASMTHPTAIVAANARVGVGAVVYPYAVISNGALLDDFVHLNYYASVGHDARVGKYCLLAPYATLNGACVLEDEVYMSTHSTVVPTKRVGKRAKISANTAVMQDVAAGSFVFGVPGKQVAQMKISSSEFRS